MKKVVIALTLSVITIQASWLEGLSGLLGSTQKVQPSTTKADTHLSNTDMTSALKEALSIGVKFAVKDLSRDGGYLNNPLVKIPLPKNLQASEKMLRKIGGGKYADDLILSMNRAAQEAAPKTVDIFMDSIKSMTIADAKSILSGEDDSATQYFKNNNSAKLASVIAPIVERSMANNDVSRYYDAFLTFYKSNSSILENRSVSTLVNASGLSEYLPNQKDENLNSFVTNRAIDGLMSMVAKKEREIRDNPLMRNSDLLKKVFGAF